jgi:hypothetical protein
MDDVQRSLGRIEGRLDQILAEQRSMREDLGDHKNEDQKNFSSVRALFFEKLEHHNAVREAHLKDQDEKLETIMMDSARAKGAGWVILGLLGSLATLLGGAVIAVLDGRIKFH